MSVVVGIDSAPAATGLAVVERVPGGRERLVYSGVFPARTAADVERIVLGLSLAAPALVVVEAPFMGINSATAILLAATFGRFLQALEVRGLRTTPVLASSWQIALLQGLITRTSDRATRKLAARRWVRAVYAVDVGEDQADAIGVATWGLRHVLQPEAQRAQHRRRHASDPLPFEALR